VCCPPHTMSSPTAASLPSSQSHSQSQSQSQSQQQPGDSISEEAWWRLSTTSRTEPRPHPLPNTPPTLPTLPALHAETLSLTIQRDALSPLLSTTATVETNSAAAAIATLDVRLRALVLSMVQYSSVNASPPEQQVMHAIHAASEANKVVKQPHS